MCDNWVSRGKFSNFHLCLGGGGDQHQQINVQVVSQCTPILLVDVLYNTRLHKYQLHLT